MTTKIIRESLGEAIERQPQTTVISEYDAWNHVHHFRITWMPEVVRDVALGHENIGQVPIVWDGECPVRAGHSRTTGGVVLKSDAVQVAFERCAVVEACRVDSLDDLEPGAYFVEEL